MDVEDRFAQVGQRAERQDIQRCAGLDGQAASAGQADRKQVAGPRRGVDLDGQYVAGFNRQRIGNGEAGVGVGGGPQCLKPLNQQA